MSKDDERFEPDNPYDMWWHIFEAIGRINDRIQRRAARKAARKAGFVLEEDGWQELGYIDAEDAGIAEGFKHEDPAVLDWKRAIRTRAESRDYNQAVYDHLTRARQQGRDAA